MAYVKSTKTVGIVVLANHAIYDAVSITRWAKDLGGLILGRDIARVIPHKAFAEAYYLHRTSLVAKLAIDHHVDRLRGIGAMRQALWPPPQSFQSVPDRAAVPNQEGKAEVVAGGGCNNPEIIRYRRFPNIGGIGRRPSTIVYAAIASFNASITGSKLAILAMMMVGREWAFIDDTLAQLLPDPMGIAGPTLTASIAIVKVSDAEQVSQFLARVQEELKLLRRFQHVPLDFPAHLGKRTGQCSAM